MSKSKALRSIWLNQFRRVCLAGFLASTASVASGEFRVATFEADITIPIGHACMGGGVQDAKEIVDPLLAKGFVLLGAGKPIVVVALDWCQCNNDSYDRWRAGLAKATGTSNERVMLATVHQHDAPICDLTAQRLLDQHGLQGWTLRSRVPRTSGSTHGGGTPALVEIRVSRDADRFRAS